ncbi:lytic transglycosylase domain-containing protein [Xanthobacter versatilis]|uniref:lytic transglycosylase domain-containing protein n=1 Tax=Xanthobacter autotrophicus (strain ATCC BAA-1158 / Py2) TaxID=78245 RepID=UPI00372A2994
MFVPRRQPATRRSSTAPRLGLLLLSGLLATGITPVDVLAQEAAVSRPEAGDPFDAPIAEAAQRFGIPAAWIRAVIRTESDGETHVISPKGAMGLMQIMPETWAEQRERHRLGDDPFDPRDNILAAAAYLRELLDRYGAPGALAAYYAGPARYEAYLAGRPLPAETRAYVARLAPVFNGEDLPTPTLTPIVDPHSWRGAPLFVAQLEHMSSDSAPAVAGRAGPIPNALVPGASSVLAPPPEGLFVALSGTGGRP